MAVELMVPEIEELVHKRMFAELRAVLDELDEADVADVLEELPEEEEAVVFRLLPRDRSAEVFSELDTEAQTELLEKLSTESVSEIINDMLPDDRTALLEELPAEVTQKLLSTLSPEKLAVARQLLGYPEDSVGRLMTPQYVSLQPEMTAEQALAKIRRVGKNKETLNVLFLVDERRHLLGSVQLEDLVLAEPQQTLESLEEGSVVSIAATEDREEAVRKAEHYDQLAIAVVDSRNILVGIVTIDDLIDVAEEEATEDIQKMGAVAALEASYFGTSVLTLARKRIGWLIALFVAGSLTATVLHHFEKDFIAATSLILFIPLIISSGGNSGSQSASLIIRGLAVQEISMAHWLRVLGRELSMGLLMGLVLAVFGFLRVWLWGMSLPIAAVVSAGLVVVVLMGTLAGALFPLLLKRLGFDPAISSTPFIASFVDIVGIILYLSIAQAILN